MKGLCASPLPQAAPGRSITILVVEDEVLVRFAVASNLRDAGYTVLEAASADEALRVLHAEASIDLVFSDVNMPGEMSGSDLARWIEQNRPRVKVLLTSGAGWPAGTVHAPGLIPIDKPYRFADLEGRIKALLGTG